MSLAEFFHILNPSRPHQESVHKYIESSPSLRCAWIERSAHPTHLETVLNWALVEGHSRLAIWGGDGTLSRSIQFLYENGVLDKITLTLFPSGTCNDFYRKIKLMSSSAGHIPQDKREQQFDLGVLKGDSFKRTFINNAGFGRTQSALKKARSHPIKDILSLTEKTIELRWSDSGRACSELRRALLGVVCNSPFFNCGLHFTKECDPTDGLLDGFFEGPQPKAGLVWKFVKGRMGSALSGSNTFSVRSPQIRVSSNHELFPQVDGEPAADQGVKELTFSILPKAVNFIFLENVI